MFEGLDRDAFLQAKEHEFFQERKDAKLCFCGRIATEQYRRQWLCAKHADHDRKMFRAASIQDPSITAENIKTCNARCEKERYARLKSAGLCVTCGKSPAIASAVRCEGCQEKRRKWRTRFYGQATQFFAYGRIHKPETP